MMGRSTGPACRGIVKPPLAAYPNINDRGQPVQELVRIVHLQDLGPYPDGLFVFDVAVTLGHFCQRNYIFNLTRLIVSAAFNHRS